jgi:hypothetical protein
MRFVRQLRHDDFRQRDPTRSRFGFVALFGALAVLVAMNRVL